MTMMPTAEVFGARFDTRNEADSVRTAIEAAGYDPSELSYILDSSVCSSTFDEVGSHWRAGPIGGVVAGGALGLGTAAGMAAAGFGSGILLLGPIGALIGAATGGIVGFILGAALASPAQASACEAAVNDGALVLIVQTHPGDAARIRGLLGKHLIAEEYV